MIEPSPTFRCCLTGAAALTTQCGELILRTGGAIDAVVSRHEGVRAWAAGQRLNVFATIAEARTFAVDAPVDFLFSVINPVLLSAEDLAWPRRLAINYHDGPLPRYAGVHATSWAILHGETSHGITWHRMTVRADAGAVLKQVLFPIGPRDTAFELNVRCHETALSSFAILLDELISGRLAPRAQDLSERTYFGARIKHPDGGVIRWNQPADSIDRMIRAHTLGPVVTNDFGLPKIATADGFVVPLDGQITRSASAEAPGTVTLEESGDVVVATGTDALRIQRIAQPDGEILSARDGLRSIGLRNGDVLPVVAEAEAARVAEALESAASNEPFCAAALAPSDVADLPVPPDGMQSQPVEAVGTTPPGFASADPAARIEQLRLAVLLWAGWPERERAVTVGYSTDAMLQRSAGLERWLCPSLPLTVALSLAETAAAAAARVSAQCNAIDARGVYPRDLPLRYKLPAAAPAVTLHIGDATPPTAHPAARLAVRIASDGHSIRLSAPADCGRASYSAGALQAIVEQIIACATAVAAAPDSPLADLDLLPPPERGRILAFNPAAEEPPQQTVPSVFEAVAARAPGATAVVGSDGSLSYGELNKRANRLTHRLITAGVLPGMLIGVCVPRSVEMIVAVLGCLKAGGAYVPIAADLPGPRRAQLLSDAGLRHVITTSTAQPLFESVEHCIAVDKTEAMAARAGENLIVERTAAHPAYVNYTSGSTGVPKGVLVPHAGITRLVLGEPSIRPANDARVLQAAPLSFDAATYEIWGALLNGATLVLLPAGPVSPDAIGQTIRHHRVDTLFLTTALFNQMVEMALPAFAGVHHLITGGEAMSASHAARFRQSHPHCRLTNAYGPTENATFSTVHAVTTADAAVPVPIGRPIRHSRAYVLDAARQLLPVGMTGELYVAGAGLAIGYLNRPELTAERFVPDPFVPGERMYRTGDLARWDGAGQLHFAGRVDRQVKIRGFRIEPGEIEAVLLTHPDIQGCAVVVRDDGPGGRRLVAYLVPKPGADLKDAREFVAGRLPDYMIPSAFVTLPRLPLTANAKLDTKALPAPEPPVTSGRRAGNECEAILCRLMAETLEIPSVGAEDDFFELGGHSLLAIQFASRVREAMDVELPLRLLFEHPTIAALVEHLPITQSQRPPLTPRPRPEAIPLSAAQRRLWFLQQLNGPNATYNIVLAHRLEGPLNVTALRSAFDDLVARHETLRTVFPARAGTPVQKILPPESARCDFAVESCPEMSVAERVLEHANVALDLSRQAPLYVRLIRLGPQRHVLVLVLHHIAGDGWSLRPLWNEVSAAYASRCRGEVPGFEQLSIQYADYTLWQRDLLGETKDPQSLIARQLRFWQQALADAPAESTLPPDFPRPPVGRHRGATLPVHIEAGLHQQLAALAREAGASLFMVLQTGFGLLLSREGAGEDIVLGSPMAGRGNRALDQQIGFYVNTLPLRIDLRGNPTFRQLIERARTFTLGAYANQDVPFDDVVQAVQPSRVSGRNAVFQVMLALQNLPATQPELAGLAVQREPLARGSSKVDLLLELTESTAADGLPGGLVGAIEYDTDLYRPATIEWIAGHLVRLLRVAVAAPDQVISRLDETPECGPAATTRTIRELLQTSARQNGDAPAIHSEHHPSLTHAGLADVLESLTGQLRSLSIGRGDRVAIVLPNGPEMALSFLAVTSVASAAPLNPAYRTAEFEFFLGDLDAKALIVTEAADSPAVPVAQARGMNIVRITREGGAVRFVGEVRAESTAGCEPPRPEDVALLLHTSGTTARPKLVPLSQENLCISAANIRHSLNLSPADNCLNVMPLFHIHGIAAALLASLSAGAAVVCSDGFDATKFLGHLRRFHPTWYSAVPTMHAAILDRAKADPDARALAPLRLIRSSSAALPPTVAEGLEATFGVPVIEAYGMTEAAHQMCSNPLPPLPRKLGSVGLPAGPEVAVLNAAGDVAARGESGEVAIRGRQVTAGYAANPQANAEAFTNGWFRTGDLGRQDADGYLFLSGRSKEIINRGGEKISPREIDEVLLRHPAVAAAVAFAMPDARLGEDVAAAVVLRAGQTATEREIMQFATAHLADFKVPRRVIMLADLPKGATGKVQRVGLAKTLGLTAAARPAAATFAGAATITEQALLEIWERVLDRKAIGTADSFFDLGGDSVLAGQVISRVGAAGLGDLPIFAFFENPTVGAMAKLLDEQNVLDDAELERLLAEVEAMSEAAAEAMLAEGGGS